MVFDLVRIWYTGLGAKYGMDPTTETMFYRSRASVGMEHVCAAFGIMTQSTSFEVHVKEVELMLRTLIKRQEGSFTYERSTCGDYFVLSTRNKRTMHYDVNQQMGHLGPGLTSQILNIIERGCTNGLPNIKYATENNTESVHLNCRYAASVHNLTEHAILKILARLNKTLPTKGETYDEKSYVFRSSVRESICHPETSAIKHDEIKDVEYGNLKLALEMLSYCVTEKGEAMWSTPQSVESCRTVDETCPNAEPYKSDPTKFKVCL